MLTMHFLYFQYAENADYAQLNQRQGQGHKSQPICACAVEVTTDM